MYTWTDYFMSIITTTSSYTATYLYVKTICDGLEPQNPNQNKLNQTKPKTKPKPKQKPIIKYKLRKCFVV